MPILSPLYCLNQTTIRQVILAGGNFSRDVLKETKQLCPENQELVCHWDWTDLIVNKIDCASGGFVAREIFGFPVWAILTILFSIGIVYLFKSFIQKPKPKEQVEQEEPEGFSTETKATFQVLNKEKFEAVLGNVRQLTTQGAIQCPPVLQTGMNIQAKATGGRTTKKPMVEYWEFYSIENKETGEIFIKHRIENIPENKAMFDLIKAMEKKGTKKQLEQIAEEEGLEKGEYILLIE